MLPLSYVESVVDLYATLMSNPWWIFLLLVFLVVCCCGECDGDIVLFVAVKSCGSTGFVIMMKAVLC